MGNCTCMYNYLRCCFRQPSTKKVILLLLGLENAGKTTVAKGLAHELENGVVPTVGFSSVTLSYKKFTVVLYDIGGGPGIRAIWHKYFVDAHGVIFVLDSSDVDKVIECRDILKNLLSNEKLSGKPLLVLGNKQDVEGALDEIDIVELLHLEDLVNQQKCPTLVETCSALSLQKSRFKDDQVIQNAFKWLLCLIERDYEGLNDRVERDMLLQKEIDQNKFSEKLKRVKEARLNKEDSIDENGVRNVHQLEVNEINEKDHHFDPFRPIGDLVNATAFNGKVEDTHKNGHDGVSAKATDTCDNNTEELHGSKMRVKRLRRQDGVCEELNGEPHNTRDVFSCFCNKSNVSSETNVLKSSKQASAKRFGLWRSNKTVPLDAGGSGEGSDSVWAIRLPANERVELCDEGDPTLNVPQAFTVSTLPETTVELEEFTGVKPVNKTSPFPAMKG